MKQYRVVWKERQKELCPCCKNNERHGWKQVVSDVTTDPKEAERWRDKTWEMDGTRTEISGVMVESCEISEWTVVW